MPKKQRISTLSWRTRAARVGVIGAAYALSATPAEVRERFVRPAGAILERLYAKKVTSDDVTAAYAAAAMNSTSDVRDRGDPMSANAQSSARAVMDSIWMQAARPSAVRRVTVESDFDSTSAVLADATATTGRGLVLVLPHFGSYSIGPLMAAAHDAPISVVAKADPGTLQAMLVERACRRAGAELIPVRRSAGSRRDVIESAVAAARAGRVVATMGDIYVRHSGVDSGIEVYLSGSRRIVAPGRVR